MDPPVVERLNLRNSTEAHLAPDTYLTFAGTYDQSLVDQINQSVADQFGPTAFDPFPPPAHEMNQLAIASYLDITLPFRYAFERTEDGMDFKGTQVKSFSLPYSQGTQHRKEKAKQQVIVKYPPEENSFIVELVTRNTDHHLILAKINPGTTLTETIYKTLTYSDTLPPEELDFNQKLEVPLFNFDLQRNYNEFIGKTIQTENSDNVTIEKAEQNIRFQLDERGALLRSDSMIICAFCAPPSHCIFDDPFLLMIRYKDSDMPYFAMWIDNAEIIRQEKRSSVALFLDFSRTTTRKGRTT